LYVLGVLDVRLVCVFICGSRNVLVVGKYLPFWNGIVLIHVLTFFVDVCILRKYRPFWNGVVLIFVLILSVDVKLVYV